MTIYGWDASHHDWDRGPMDIAAAVADGISFMTHKIGEAHTVVDEQFDNWYRRARGVVPLLGAYYVNWPGGDQAAQADRMLSMLDDKAPGWRDGPFILQVDAERFDYMPREPNPSECEAFCDRLVQRTGGDFRPVLYAPEWLYGGRLKGVHYPLWASGYGSNPTRAYRQAYPGDGSSRWDAYSGQVPAILQYGSRTRIGSQPTCDANAFRGMLAQLRNIVYPKGEDDMSASSVWDETKWPDFKGKPVPARIWVQNADIYAGRAWQEAKAVHAGQAALAAKIDGQNAVIAGLVDLVKAGGGNVDTAAVMSTLNGLVGQVADLTEQLAQAKADLADRDARLAGALTPES